MDQHRFDSLARALAGASSRRAALGAALAALLPAAAEGKRNRNAKKDRARDRKKDHEHDRRAKDPARGDHDGKGARDGRGSATDGDGRGPVGAACLAVGQPCGKGSGKRGKKGKKGKRRKADPCTKCCSRHAVAQANGRSRCACKPAGSPAGNAAQCCSGRISSGGFCGTCDPGLTECDGGCVNLKSDDSNCGRCGNACGAGQHCADGRCACDAESCPDGCCDGSGQCRPGTANNACGAGGAVCAACASPDTCGGGSPGAPRTCGCTPDATPCAGKNCGTVTDRCGGTVNCPDPGGATGTCSGSTPVCSAGNACVPCSAAAPCPGGGCCQPDGSCAADGADCDDGDACTAGSTCSAGVCGGGTTVCTTPPDCRTAVGATCSAGVCAYPALADPGTPCGAVPCGACDAAGICLGCQNGGECRAGACDCAASPPCPVNTVRQPDCTCRCSAVGFVEMDGVCFRKFPDQYACFEAVEDRVCSGGLCSIDGTSVGAPVRICDSGDDCPPGTACIEVVEEEWICYTATVCSA